MSSKKKILAIIGSTRANSSNLKLVLHLAALTKDSLEVTIFESLSKLPHFNPDLDKEHPPRTIVQFRQLIAKSDGIIICTPEYVFSMPGSLKNAIEWCVSTTLFAQKPVGLITASASGIKGHKELQLVMKTVQAKFNRNSTLLISGIKSKFDEQGNLIDLSTKEKLSLFVRSFERMLH